MTFTPPPKSHPPRESGHELESLRSGGAVSEYIQNRVRNFLVETHSYGERIDSEIATISILRSVISPVKNVPAEILREIFVRCGDQGPIVLPPRRNRFPWTLADVCSRWRQVLWGTSEIWKDILVPANITTLLSSLNGSVQAILRSVVSRAGPQVSLKVPGGVGDSVIDIVSSSPERFKTLDIAINFHGFCKLLDLPHGAFRVLESLKISLYDVKQIQPPYETTSFQGAPNLRKVSFDITTSTCYLPCVLLLPWAQLTDVRISRMKIAPSKIHSILQSCTSLATVELLIGQESRAPSTSAVTIYLPTLTTMSLSCDYGDAVEWDQFLHPFVLPSLDEFSLRTPTRAWPQVAFISLMYRSACRPRCVSILDGSAAHFPNPDNIYSLIQALPSIVDFRTTFVIPPSIFDAIARDNPVPKLTHIKCRVHLDGLESFSELMRHYSVCAPSSGVKSASIGCLMEEEGGDEAFTSLCCALREYKKEGRDLKVYHDL